MLVKQVAGNYEIRAGVSATAPLAGARIGISGDGSSGRVILDINERGLSVVRNRAGGMLVVREFPGPGKPPWRVHVLKKGNFFRFRVNDATGWIRGPSGEWEGLYEPRDSELMLDGSGGCVFDSCTVTTLPWLNQPTEPVIALGPAGSHYEKQIIPGAVLETGGRFYMYCMAGMAGEQEGASRRSIAVAESEDLRSWRMAPSPVLAHTDAPGDNIYVNGAVATPDGRIVIMYAVQRYPSWIGFMIASADHPTGPFTPHPGNPVYRHFNAAAHEFDLKRVDHPDYRYILFYAGYTPGASGGWPGGDRGYLLHSDDLVNWREAPGNPVFGPETAADWDAVHVRPRSLNRIADTWYLWYEGCNAWTPPGEGGTEQWCDSVGLARSPDLKNWSYYPRNPALPALGIGAARFDHTWTGWPRMVVRGDMAYVFYTGNAQVGLRTIPVCQLTDWADEGGETVRIV